MGTDQIEKPVFELVLHERIGPVVLGMDAAALRAALPGTIESTEAGVDPEFELEVNAADYFIESGIKAEYDAKGKVIFIEAGSLVEVRYKGRDLFEMSFGEIVTLFRKLDPELETDMAGFSSEKLGLATYAPGGYSMPDNPVQLFAIFAEGYFDGI